MKNTMKRLLGGLLLVNEWHSRPSDFDESSLVSIMTYARSMGVTKSIWRNSDQKLFPVAANALLDALNAAKEAGLEGYVVREAYRSISRPADALGRGIQPLERPPQRVDG